MEQYPKAYIYYLIEFHATRDLFECHELLEEYWKENPSDPRAKLWVALIQLAVGAYHERRGNRKGASKMYAESLKKLNKEHVQSELGIDQEELIRLLETKVENVLHMNSEHYEDINFKFVDKKLEQTCRRICEMRGLIWGAESPLHNEDIIHRHTKRDRSEVTEARRKALALKKQQRCE